MKKILLLLIVAIFAFCAWWFWLRIYTSPTTVVPGITTSPGIYVAFSLNAQEFGYVDEGIETVNQVIDLHEEYEVPLEIFLTNGLISIYEDEAPELLERLKTSEMVAVSYHIRPPLPYYTGYDFLGLEDMTSRELYEMLLSYEEHALDLNTGLPTNEDGGYEHLKNLMGYAPFSIGMQSGSKVVGEIASRVFSEKGATFQVVHGDASTPYESGECLYVRNEGMMDLGDEIFDLYVKPEQVSVRLFQCVGLDPGQVMEDGLLAYEGDGDVFLNIKIHDNDFYSDKSSWTQAYLGKGRTAFEAGDFDYQDFIDESHLLGEEDRSKMWELYEDAILYVSEHPEKFTAINVSRIASL